MNDKKLKEKICDELHELGEMRNWSTSDLEKVAKLADAKKNIAKTEYYEMQGGDGISRRNDMSRNGMNDSYRAGDMRYSDYDNGDSYARHYVRGHYSNATNDSYGRYRDSKARYSRNGGEDCKVQMMDAIEDCMDDYVSRIKEIMENADCAEERERVRKYVDKLRNI